MPGAKNRKQRQADARGRILKTAVHLFQAQGYSTTGINQIIAESEASKASFYYYYSSKEDLGREYLATLSTEQMGFFRDLMRRYPAPPEFVRAWVKFMQRQARGGNFFGCHMANFRAQLGEEERSLEEDLRGLARQTITVLTEYLTEAREAGRIAGGLEPTSAARRLFAAYEGVIQVWMLTGDVKAMDDLVVLADGIWGGR